MRDYGIVRDVLWSGSLARKIREGGLSAHLVALCLETGPGSTMLGIYPLAIPTLMHQTGLSMPVAKKALQHLDSIGFAVYDEDREIVWVTGAAERQISGWPLRPGDNRLKGIREGLARFEACCFYPDFVARYREAFLLEAPSKPLRRGFEGASSRNASRYRATKSG